LETRSDREEILLEVLTILLEVLTILRCQNLVLKEMTKDNDGNYVRELIAQSDAILNKLLNNKLLNKLKITNK